MARFMAATISPVSSIARRLRETRARERIRSGRGRTPGTRAEDLDTARFQAGGVVVAEHHDAVGAARTLADERHLGDRARAGLAEFGAEPAGFSARGGGAFVARGRGTRRRGALGGDALGAPAPRDLLRFTLALGEEGNADHTHVLWRAQARGVTVLGIREAERRDALEARAKA